MNEKIQSPQNLAHLLTTRQSSGERVVLTNGCFDLLHVGHTRFLQAARELGDLLVVAVNSDASVHSLGKGENRPIVPQDQRCEVLAALTCIDFVVLFHDPDPQAIVTLLHPDVLVKGGDWAPDKIIGRREVEARGGTVYTIPLIPDISTSTLVQRIQQGQRSPLLDGSQSVPESRPQPVPLRVHPFS